MSRLLALVLLSVPFIACSDDTSDDVDNQVDTTVVDVDVDANNDASSPSYPSPGSDSLVDREKGDTSPDAFDGTVMELAGGEEEWSGEMPRLIAVRTGYHEGYDRIVFEFSGETMPSWWTEYVDEPAHECGSGEQRFLAGEGWLQIDFDGTAAHTDAGEPTITDRDRTLSLPNLKEMALTCDFEANLTWVLGLTSPEPYRAVELTNPTRLVIDIRHPSNVE